MVGRADILLLTSFRNLKDLKNLCNTHFFFFLIKVPYLEKEPPYLEVFSPTYVSVNTSGVPFPDIDEKVPHLEKEPPYLEVFSPTYVSENTSRVPFPDIDESSVRTPIFSFPVRSKIQTAEIRPPLSSSRPA